MEEVIVEAPYIEKDISNISSRYSIDEASFARLNVFDISSALRRLPGVTLRDYGGAGGMKTISVRGMGSQHTGVTLNGLLIPDIQTGQIDLQQFQLSEIASLSISTNGLSDIFQPARNFSKTAVLAIETQQPEGGNVTFNIGSWGLWSPSAYYSHAIKQTTITLQGGYQQANNNYSFVVDNGVDTHREHRQNSKTKQGYFSTNILWQPNSTSSLSTTLRLSDNYRQLPGIVHLYTNDNDERLRDRDLLLQAQYNVSFSPKWKIKTAIRWTLGNQKYHNGQPSGGIQSEKYLQREYYATASVLFIPIQSLFITYSADYWHNSLRTTLAANPRPKRNSFVQALSAKWNIDRLSFMAQMLSSIIAHEHHLSPTIGASYRLLPRREFYIRLMWKDNFRMPTVTEMYYYHLGSQDLRPEKTQQVNLGLSYHHNKTSLRGLEIEISANAYINTVKDKIVSIPVNMFVCRFLNLEKCVGKGLDGMLHIEYFFSERHSLSITTNYSLQDMKTRPTNKEFSPSQIAYTPVHSGSSTLAWQNKWFGASTTLLFASATWTTNEHNSGTRIAGYAEWSASIYKNIPIRKTDLGIKCIVQNLLNHNYCIIAHYPMPGRNVNLSLTFKY